MRTQPPLDGSVSIVTGARGVIGAGIARALAAAGSHVVVQIERDPDRSIEVTDPGRAGALVDDIEHAGRRALPVNCDVTNAQQVAAMVDRTIKEFGQLDVLVNNAGIVMTRRVEEMAEADWDKVMNVNLKGMFLCAQAAIPHLRKSAGTIINNGSIAGFGGAPGLAHYCASKHAVIGLTKSLALELAQDDVTVNAICPGIVDTPMWSDVLTPDRAQYEAVVARAIPLGRDQTADDMGRLAVFLATSRNITGETIKVDGGITSPVM